MSQERLADLSRVHPTYMSRIELGKVSITLMVAERIANALGMPLSALVAEAEQRFEKSRT